jgi:tetratricopeptide (TPR) repeat protein
MSLASSRLLIAVSVAGLFCLAPLRMSGQATPQYQSDKEFQLYDAILKDTNPKTKLEKIQDWEKQFPTTNFTKERKQLYFTTYIALNMPKETVAEAKLILADSPMDFNALYYTMLLTRALYPVGQQASVLDDGEKASQALLSVIGTPPPGVSADQWAKLRPDIENLAYVTQGFIGMQRKNWDAAEAQLRKALELNPNNSEVDYMMYFTLANKKNNSAALYYQARAASYDGPGSLAAAQRQGVLAEVQKAYTSYHGSAEGLNELLAAAKSAPNPAADFHIKSKGELAKEGAVADAAAEEKFRKEHPDLALWKSLKETLSGPTGAEYFEKMKDSKVPTLKGKVVRMEPALKPKTIFLAMEDGSTGDASTADATLKFDAPLTGKVDPGTELTFEGVPQSYTASPLMVVFTIVDKADLHGWTGKNATPAPVHHTPAKKK